MAIPELLTCRPHHRGLFFGRLLHLVRNDNRNGTAFGPYRGRVLSAIRIDKGHTRMKGLATGATTGAGSMPDCPTVAFVDAPLLQ